MGVPEEALEGFLLGLMFNGTIEDTGDRINGRSDRYEEIYTFVPLPPGPRVHPTRTPPEVVWGYTEILSPRGMPVRIRTERDQRRTMSTPGARGRIKRREQRYQAMQEAVEKRKQVQAVRAKEAVTNATSGKKKAMAMAEAKAKKREAKHKKNTLFSFNSSGG